MIGGAAYECSHGAAVGACDLISASAESLVMPSGIWKN